MGSPKYPQNAWFISWKNPIRMDDLGVPSFQETPICEKMWKWYGMRCQHQRYPEVKRGNGKSSVHGGVPGKIIYKWWILVDVLLPRLISGESENKSCVNVFWFITSWFCSSLKGRAVPGWYCWNLIVLFNVSLPTDPTNIYCSVWVMVRHATRNIWLVASLFPSLVRSSCTLKITARWNNIFTAMERGRERERERKKKTVFFFGGRV